MAFSTFTNGVILVFVLNLFTAQACYMDEPKVDMCVSNSQNVNGRVFVDTSLFTGSQCDCHFIVRNSSNLTVDMVKLPSSDTCGTDVSVAFGEESVNKTCGPISTVMTSVTDTTGVVSINKVGEAMTSEDYCILLQPVGDGAELSIVCSESIDYLSTSTTINNFRPIRTTRQTPVDDFTTTKSSENITPTEISPTALVFTTPVGIVTEGFPIETVTNKLSEPVNSPAETQGNMFDIPEDMKQAILQKANNSQNPIMFEDLLRETVKSTAIPQDITTISELSPLGENISETTPAAFPPNDIKSQLLLVANNTANPILFADDFLSSLSVSPTSVMPLVSGGQTTEMQHLDSTTTVLSRSEPPSDIKERLLKLANDTVKNIVFVGSSTTTDIAEPVTTQESISSSPSSFLGIVSEPPASVMERILDMANNSGNPILIEQSTPTTDVSSTRDSPSTSTTTSSTSTEGTTSVSFKPTEPDALVRNELLKLANNSENPILIESTSTSVLETTDLSETTDSWSSTTEFTTSVQTTESTTLTPSSSTADKSGVSTTTKQSTVSTTTDQAAVSTSKDQAGMSSTTDKSTASTTTYTGVVSSSTDQSVASTSTDQSVPSTSTEQNVVSSTTDQGVVTTTTDKSIVSSTTDQSFMTTTTDQNAESSTIIPSTVKDTTTSETTTFSPTSQTTTADIKGSTTDPRAETTTVIEQLTSKEGKDLILESTTAEQIMIKSESPVSTTYGITDYPVSSTVKTPDQPTTVYNAGSATTSTPKFSTTTGQVPDITSDRSTSSSSLGITTESTTDQFSTGTVSTTPDNVTGFPSTTSSMSTTSESSTTGEQGSTQSVQMLDTTVGSMITDKLAMESVTSSTSTSQSTIQNEIFESTTNIKQTSTFSPEITTTTKQDMYSTTEKRGAETTSFKSETITPLYDRTSVEYNTQTSDNQDISSPETTTPKQEIETSTMIQETTEISTTAPQETTGISTTAPQETTEISTTAPQETTEISMTTLPEKLDLSTTSLQETTEMSSTAPQETTETSAIHPQETTMTQETMEISSTYRSTSETNSKMSSGTTYPSTDSSTLEVRSTTQAEEDFSKSDFPTTTSVDLEATTLHSSTTIEVEPTTSQMSSSTDALTTTATTTDDIATKTIESLTEMTEKPIKYMQDTTTKTETSTQAHQDTTQHMEETTHEDHKDTSVMEQTTVVSDVKTPTVTKIVITDKPRVKSTSTVKSVTVMTRGQGARNDTEDVGPLLGRDTLIVIIVGVVIGIVVIVAIIVMLTSYVKSRRSADITVMEKGSMEMYGSGIDNPLVQLQQPEQTVETNPGPQPATNKSNGNTPPNDGMNNGNSFSNHKIEDSSIDDVFSNTNNG